MPYIFFSLFGLLIISQTWACTDGVSWKGRVSGKTYCLPEVNKAPSPEIAPPGVVLNGNSLTSFKVENNPGQPDSRSFRKKFGLLIPATNTTMEHELWSIIFNNQAQLKGVGLHTVNVQTPKFSFKTAQDLIDYRENFIKGLALATDQALIARPEYLIMGMSLEHVIYGLDKIKEVMTQVSSKSDIGWASWHEASDAALKKFKAKRIAIISPFNEEGNKNAIKMFQDLGYEVIASFGFACANAYHIAHISDSMKEKAILDYLATPENRLDAIVQLGTNMSMLNVTEKLEPTIKIPILGINATIFWYALRENGISESLKSGGRLFKEF
jgi:maleate isomerase